MVHGFLTSLILRSLKGNGNRSGEEAGQMEGVPMRARWNLTGGHQINGCARKDRVQRAHELILYRKHGFASPRSLEHASSPHSVRARPTKVSIRGSSMTSNSTLCSNKTTPRASSSPPSSPQSTSSCTPYTPQNSHYTSPYPSGS